LCTDCVRRFETNPLRTLDCKNPACKEATAGAPEAMTSLCRTCMDHFESVKALLKELQVPFEVNGRMVRGLDYYTGTTFEVLTEKLGAQNAVAAGGRYDGLVEEIGGPDIPGIGFALGVERIAALLPEEAGKSVPLDLYLAPLGEEARHRAPHLLYKLRSEGIRADTDYQKSSLKSQMRHADKIGARFVGMLGEKELTRGVMLLRNMKNKKQTEIPLDEIVGEVLERVSQTNR
jgi:histidyl-tRNA synthetase